MNAGTREYLDAIANHLSGQEWSSDTLQEIADILISAGYVIDEPAE